MREYLGTHAFSRMKQHVSAAVRYRLQARNTGVFLRGSVAKWEVTAVRWTPRRAREKVARNILSQEGLKPLEEPFPESDVSLLLSRRPECRGFKLLLLHEDVSSLCMINDRSGDVPPFETEDVLKLSIDEIRRLGEIARGPEKMRLHFRRAHGADLPDGAISLQRERSALEVDAIETYRDARRETYENCHSIFRPERNGEGLAWLIENDVIVRSPVDGSYCYLGETFLYETALIDALRALESDRRSLPMPSNPQLTSGKSPCDEQMRAIEMFARNPVVAIDGSAGSGKTDTLGVLKSVSRSTMATAFQGVNAGALRGMSKKRGTAHKLLFEHCADHSTEGFFRTCAFAGVDCLVVDEAGTMTLELLSKMVSSFVVCSGGSHPRRLILSGDLGQLPPIGGPAPFRELRSHFSRIDSLAEFGHNHRVREGAKLVCDNANRVAAGNASEIEWNSENFVLLESEDSVASVISIVEGLNVQDYVVVTRTNADRKEICSAIESLRGGKEIERRHPRARDVDAAVVGQKFCFTKNDYELGLINNEILILDGILDVRRTETRRLARCTKDPKPRHGWNRKLLIRTLDGRKRIIPWDPKKTTVKKAACVTSNAMQGSSAKIIVRADFGASRFSTRERLYTDITRAEEQFHYVGKKEWFDQACARKEPPKRSHLGLRMDPKRGEKRPR